MKKILPLTITLCGVAALIAVVVRAANPPPPPPTLPAVAPATAPHPGDKFAGMIADRLGLTAEQKTKLEGLRQAQRTALDAVAEDKALSPEDRRAKVRGIMESNRDQMRAVLTPEQQEKMAMVREHFMRGRPGGPTRFDRGGRDFARQMRHRAMRAHQMMQHLREHRAEVLGLTDEQRAKMRQITFQHHEKAIALQKELRSELESVLTPEQKIKAREMKERHGPMGWGPRHDGGSMGPPPGN